MLVLDEWHHKDFFEVGHQEITDENLRYTYELYKNESREGGIMDFDSFAAIFREQEQRNEEYNQQQWQENRPSSYETWQQIAKVIVIGYTSMYKPTLQPNTHWKNWPKSGSL